MGTTENLRPDLTNNLLRPYQAAEYTGVSISKLAKLRMREQRHLGPSFIKLGGSVLYRRRDLDCWLECHLVVGGQ